MNQNRSVPPVPTSMIMLASVLGFSAGMSLELYTLLYRVNSMPPNYDNQGDMAVLQILYFLAFCIAYIVISRNAKQIYQYRSLVLIVVALLILAPLFIQLVSPRAREYELFFMAIEWLMLGIGICGLRTMWELFYSLYFSQSSELYISLSFIGAALLTSAFVLLSEQLAWLVIAYAIIVVATSALGILLLRKTTPEQEVLVTASRQFSSYITSDTLVNGAQGIVFGYCVSTIIDFGTSATIPVAVSLLLGSAAALLVVVLRSQRNYSFALLLNRLLPVAVFFLLLSPLFERSMQIFCSCVILTIIIYTQVRKIALGAVINNRSNLNPITHSTLVALPYAAGAAVGYLTFVVFSRYLMLERMDLFIATILFVLAIMLFYYWGALRLLNPPRSRLSHVLDSEESEIGSSLSSSNSNSAPYENQIPPDAMPLQQKQTTPRSLANEEDSSQNRKGAFGRHCDQIIEEKSLTRREAEVFKLLVRGRNAEYISNTLFISLATAKTHIYRIYTKLDVNNHQQLIDVFEEHLFQRERADSAL